MKLKDNMTVDKLRGGYYTPKVLSDFLSEWALNGKCGLDVLEPSCGDGNFVSSALGYKTAINHFTAVEVVEEEANKARNIIKGKSNFEVLNEDFYKFYEEQKSKFDVILGNPPYIRYQYLTQKQRDEHIQILKSSDMKDNKLINVWVSFVVACVNLMKVDSKLGMVIPAELLQVKYAEDLRMFLMKKLQKITVITFSELIFPDVEQEVVLLMCEKESKYIGEHKIRVINYKNIDSLSVSSIENNKFKNIKFNDSKWTRYLLNEEENELLDKHLMDSKYIKFNEVAEVDIGITTGNNKYFCLNKETVDEYHLHDYLRPLIARSVSIRGLEFTETDWLYNIEKGAFAYLLDVPNTSYNELSEDLQAYIDYGVDNNQNIGYKCSIRNNWYAIPSIWAPDAFFLRRNYKYPKFILNTNINAVSTDTMHRIRFHIQNLNPKRYILSYYNSIGFASTELEGRSYGGGVLEVLPGELEKLTIVNLFNHEIISDEEINRHFEIIDYMIRESELDDIEEVLDYIDKKILQEKIGISENETKIFRDIWLKLRDRRLSRGNKKNI